MNPSIKKAVQQQHRVLYVRKCMYLDVLCRSSLGMMLFLFGSMRFLTVSQQIRSIMVTPPRHGGRAVALHDVLEVIDLLV